MDRFRAPVKGPQGDMEPLMCEGYIRALGDIGPLIYEGYIEVIFWEYSGH